MTRETDVRHEVQEVAKCYFNDLCRLNIDRGRGTPTKEYSERVRVRDLLGTYVSSHDISRNPLVSEGENMKSVKV